MVLSLTSEIGRGLMHPNKFSDKFNKDMQDALIYVPQAACLVPSN
jgi:hypothetical protein